MDRARRQRALALAWLARTPYALLPLLLVPVLFVALVAWASRARCAPGACR